MLDVLEPPALAPEAVEINGVVVGEVLPTNDGKFIVKGLKEQWDSIAAARVALLKRHERASELVKKHREHHSGARVTIGRALYDAVIENGLWIGRLVQESKTQVVIEIEHPDMVRVGLTELVSRLEQQAKTHTRLDGATMRARALIGAARTQIHKL